ncbi:unnamed protein product, partial [Rotaria sp. Silwood1]
MPSEIIHCVLCDRRERGARSKFTTITTMERQQKVYEAYEKRHGQPLNYSLINRKVHCSCYRALTFSFTPVPVVNRTGRPKLYKRPRRYNLTTTNTSTNHQSSFINIQRNYSQQNEAQSSSVELNMNMKMVNDYYSEEENDNILNNHLMTTIENTSSLNICSSSCHQQPLVDRSNQDIELDVRIENDGSSLQLNNIDIFSMSPINKNRTSNITFATNDLNAQRSNVINVISAAAVDDKSFEIASMTPGGTQADDDNHNYQSSEDEDCYIEWTTPAIFSSNSIQNYSMIPKKINSNEEDEYVNLKNRNEKENVRAYRAKTGTTSSSRRSHRIQTKLHEAPPCPQSNNCSDLFATAFDELCSWLIELLRSGLIVSMMDISTEYRIIAERRKENPKANMFRTSSIQKRLKFKYGDKLYFYKQSNNEVNLLGNELYRHERSEQLLTITNRLGHTPSYDTIVRLHVEAAERARLGSKPLIYPRQEISPGDHNFVVKVADNFDINPDRLHGNNSIHILNQIIISTPENNELPAMITDCVNDLLDKIMNSIISTPVKYHQSDLFKNIFIYPGDFHLHKNMMIVIWDVLQGSGIEDILENIYKGATLKSILKVHHFNKSLRCCKILYTALYILLLEAFFEETLTSLLVTDSINHLKSTMKKIPVEFASDDTAQTWFIQLIEVIGKSNLSTYLHNWTIDSCNTNSTFRLWYFILNQLLEPMLQLYASIRTCNFSARNAALYRFSPIFFATNRLNYSRLSAQHLFDLQNSSSYLFSRMEKAFAVTRSHQLRHADTYVPNTKCGSKKGRIFAENIKDYHHLTRLADQEIRRTIIIAQQRNLKPLSQFFAFEFSPVPLSLCDRDNVDSFNQQSKSTAIDFLKKIFPSSFSSSYPLSAVESALVIDGCSLFDTKPSPEAKTIRDYAIQLLDKNIRLLFETYHRIDVVFDEVESNILKRLIKVHGRNNDNTMYQLRGDDRLQLPFRQFAHCNRVVLAKCIRQCWMESDLIKYLPLGRLLVVGGPDTTAVKLQNGQAPQVDYLLESNHSESRTRLLLHTNIISLDQLQKTVIIDTTDTDVILLAIALGSTIMLHHLIIKSTSTRTKKNTFIDVKSIATGLRQAAIDPTCLLVLHSLSGCDTTSFIRNITKEKVFSYFFDYPDQYSSINKLNCIPPPYEAIAACEQLLINCYSFGRMVHSLDELRAMMAEVRMKDRTRTNIASSLPPSTSSFHQHCLRAARQVKIWLDCLDSNPTTPSMLDSGYKNVDSIDRFKIKWNDLPDQPSDSRLITCGDCKTNCKRCKCWKNNISCTIYCKCNVDSCINQPNTQVRIKINLYIHIFFFLKSITSLTSNDFLIDDSSDDARSTDASIQSDRECDDDSFISESE